jgi:phosphohistidine phosphatase
MKWLTLMRHAKSSWANAHLSDFERPINERGLRDAPRMGARLKSAALPPVDQILASPARRAEATAEAVAEALGLETAQVVWDESIYAAPLGTLLNLVQGMEPSATHVALVGHNPGMEQLARHLYPDFRGDGEKFPTCGLAYLTLDVTAWNAVGRGCATDCQFDYPKKP